MKSNNKPVFKKQEYKVYKIQNLYSVYRNGEYVCNFISSDYAIDYVQSIVSPLFNFKVIVR